MCGKVGNVVRAGGECSEIERITVIDARGQQWMREIEGEQSECEKVDRQKGDGYARKIRVIAICV
jgi:hypothetical protein